MNITKDIIVDLLPLYLSNECSPDTKMVVDEYVKANPDFAEDIKTFSRNPLPDAIPHRLKKDDEMKALEKTRRVIKRRTYFMAFAIFCSFAPFSFLYSNGTFRWLFSESPGSASVYGALAVILWAAYFTTKRKLNGL